MDSLSEQHQHSSPESSTHTSSEPTKKNTRSRGTAASNNNNNNSNNNSAAGPQQNRRNKSMRACDECRKRKVKCDGVQPCAKCRKSEIECVFAKLPPKRGPPKQYIELLEARLQLIEKALRTIDGPARRILDEALSLKSTTTSSSAATTAAAGGGGSSSPSSSINEDGRNSPIIKEEEEDVKAASTFNHNGIGEADKFSINEIGQAMYVNDKLARIDRLQIGGRGGDVDGSNYTSNDTSLSGRRSSSSRQASPNKKTSQMDNAMDTDNESTTSTTTTPAGLPQDVPMSLIKTFFSQLHKYIPMLHNPLFHKQMGNKNDPPSPLLLYAMCAVASRWTSEHNHHPTPGVIAPGFIFYQRAFAKIDEYSDAPRLSTIQALLLLTKYQEYYRRLGFFHRPGIYLGMAIKMCNDLGMSKLEGSPRNGEDAQDHESKKRTFWMVFTYDLMMSIEQGREPCFNNIDCITEYPLATSEEGPLLEEVVTNNNLMIQLVRILSDIYALIRRVAARQSAQGDQRTQIQIIEEHGRLFLLHTHLENFVHELPAALGYSPTQGSPAYPADKQAISNVFAGFLHMTFHFSVILLHRHYVLHPLPDCEMELEPYQHELLCASSASNITTIVDTMLETHPVDVFSYPTRGVQQTIHFITMAATVHRELMSSSDKTMAETAKQQHAKTIQVLNRLATESPAMEFHAQIKEADMMQINSSSNTTNANMSIASMSPETTMMPSSAPQHMPGNDRALSDVSSTSSSPTLPSTMGMATRQPQPQPQQQTYMLPKNRRHTMAGMPSINTTSATSTNIGTPVMHMGNHVSSPWSHTQSSSQQLLGAGQMPYMMDHASLFNSSAAIADPARFASLMMQSGINMPIYNHHQQPLPHIQQQQHQQQQQQQQHAHPYQTPSFMNNNGNPHPYVPPRKSRLSHPMSYSQEDLRSMRRAHMNKPINTGNFPPAHARSSPLPPDFVYPGTPPSFSDIPTTPPSPGDGYSMMNKMYQHQHHHQQPRMTRQLRRQSSMTAMMPSYYAQRHQQQQQYLPPRNRHTQPPPHPPPPLPQQQPPTSIQTSPFSSMATVAMGQQQQQQQHHRRHTISIPGEPPLGTQQSSMQQQSQYQDQLPPATPYIPYNDNSQASDNTMMSVDGTTPDYASVSFSQSDMSTPMDTTGTMMMLDPPTSGAADAAMMSDLMIGSDQWPMMAAAAGGNLEDLQQRTEGHVM